MVYPMAILFFWFQMSLGLDTDTLDTLDQSIKETINQSVTFYSSFYIFLSSPHLYLHFLMELILLKGDIRKLPQLSCMKRSRMWMLKQKVLYEELIN